MFRLEGNFQRAVLFKGSCPVNGIHYLREESTAFTLGDYSWKLVSVGTRRGWPRECHVSSVTQWRHRSGVDPHTR